MTRSRFALTIAALMVVAGAPFAAACPVCFGDPDSAMAQSANTGILVLLGFVMFMLASIVTIGGCWIVRAHKLNAASENGPKSLFSCE